MQIIQIIGEKDEKKNNSKEAINFVPNLSVEVFDVKSAIYNIKEPNGYIPT